MLCVHVIGGGGGTHIARSIGALYVLICVLLDDAFIVLVCMSVVVGGEGGYTMHELLGCLSVIIFYDF